MSNGLTLPFAGNAPTAANKSAFSITTEGGGMAVSGICTGPAVPPVSAMIAVQGVSNPAGFIIPGMPIVPSIGVQGTSVPQVIPGAPGEVFGGPVINAIGVQGTSTGLAQVPGAPNNNSIGVQGISDIGIGVMGQSAGDGVVGLCTSNAHAGVSATNDSGGFGVWARGTPGGHFESNSGVAVDAVSRSGPAAVLGTNQGSGPGVHGISTSGIGVFGEGGTLAGNFEGDVRVHGHIFSEGNINCTGDISLTGADCAEEFDISGSEGVEPGTVMVLDDTGVLIVSSQPYDRRVAGVISGAGGLRPGIVLDRNTGSARLPIALIGKVYCYVDANHAPVEVGDLLTTSATRGHAMKASDPARSFGSIIGKALRPLAQGRGIIPVLVALQ